MTVAETRDARKEPVAKAAALRLVRDLGIRNVVASRGKAIRRLDTAECGRDELAGALIGPSGNLRAPAARVGRTLLVGFRDDAWSDVLG